MTNPVSRPAVLGRGARQPSRVRRTQPSAPASAAPAWHTELFAGVEWSIPYVAFLYYTFVVITYYLPGGEVAMAVALLGLLLRPQDWRFSPSLVWFGLFTAWCLFAFLASNWKNTAWDQSYTLIKLWLIAFTAVNVVRSKAQLRFLMIWLVGCFMLFPVRGAFVNYFGGYRLFGRALWNFAYANPNDLAAFCILFCSIAACILYVARARLTRLGAVTAVGATLLLILFTQSRGALVAVGIVLTVFLVGKRGSFRLRVGAVALVLLAALAAPDSVWKRLGGLSAVSVEGGMKGVDEEGSAEQRFEIMQIAFGVAAANPLFGVGPGAYSKAHAVAAPEMGPKDAHNTYLRVAAETGMMGLLLFLIMVFTSIQRSRAAISRNAAGGTLLRFLNYGLIAFLIAGFFASLAYINMLYLMLALIDLVHLVVSNQAVSRLRPRKSFAIAQ